MPRLAVCVALALTLGGCARTIPAHADDPTIATRVKIALLNDPATGGLRIQAVSAAGVVTLSGEVGSAEQVARALQIARGVEGVRDVRAQLVVRPSTPRF